jgi:hypothetical protein
MLSILLVVTSAVPCVAAGVQARFDLSSPSGGPFPSDVFTVIDPDQNTGVRVALPIPATCPAVVPPPPAIFTVPTDCFDIAELNTLDGFNIQPRVRIPFTGSIDPTTVAGNVFFVSLGDTLSGGGGARVEVNQIVWDPATATLFAESDRLLDQHTRYALIVTNGVHDAGHDPVEAGAFASFRHDLNFGQTKSAASAAYRTSVLDALAIAGVPPSAVVAASVFTTQSATAVLEKIRQQVKSSPAAAATLVRGAPFERQPEMVVVFNRQVQVSGPLAPSFLPLDLFDPFGYIGALAFGSYLSPDYETSDQYIPAVATRTGQPTVQSHETIYFNLFIPAGTPPASGWPIAIFGHGFTDSKQGAPFTVAGVFASQGIATIAINVVGHGGGAGGSLVVLPLGVVIPSGGRGFDQNGDGAIDSTEGVNAAFPRTIVSSRDGLRQTVADIMQLVHVIETGGIPGVPLDAGRIYYAGQSFGGIYGTKLMAIEPSITVGVLNVPGGPIIDIARISPVFRLLVTQSLATRVPKSLLNGPAAAPFLGFNENIPLRNQPPVVNTVLGAIAIQEVIDNTEWAQQAGNPVAYAPHIVKSPLDGLSPKSIIVQSAKGDETVPNPTVNNILRAGDLIEHLTYYRNDLAFDADPANVSKNPHTFLTRIIPLVFGGFTPDVITIALEAQQQIAAFFASDGSTVSDPDGTAMIFETPISKAERPLLEQLNFIP